eukprot:TRINITY_DN1221_c0_g3_i1.p1 TRINITY_DN1221_c0_g3~~TRINITY_DN1221_c0_g3_i1.p1  ORF type:complete len:1011 (+),score=339.61 TRINITY_DN1221_c0_g3_i1:83-3034(+)
MGTCGSQPGRGAGAQPTAAHSPGASAPPAASAGRPSAAPGAGQQQQQHQQQRQDRPKPKPLAEATLTREPSGKGKPGVLSPGQGRSPVKLEGQRHEELKGSNEEHQRLVQHKAHYDAEYRQKLQAEFDTHAVKPEDIADEKTALRIQRMWRTCRLQRRFRGLVFRIVWRELEALDERLVPQREDAHGSESHSSPLADSARFAGSMGTKPHQGDKISYPQSGVGVMPEKKRRKLAESLVALLRRGEMIPEAYVWGILEEATEALRKRPNVQRVSLSEVRAQTDDIIKAPHANRCIVVGDLHGHLDDLMHIVDEKRYRLPESVVNKYVFNGDFVDRGDNSVEVITLLLTLLLCFPDAVFLNRGNHEGRSCSMMYGFFAEIVSKYDSRDMFDSFVHCFNSMPLCTLIEGEILVVHGGPPRTDRGNEHATLAQINGVNRFCDIPTVRPDNKSQFKRDEIILADLLWSDPGPAPAGKSDVTWIFNSTRSNGVVYRPAHSLGFCKKNSLRMIIRSHEAVDAGFVRHQPHEGRVVTVFSASNYCGLEGNDAAVAVCSLGAGDAEGDATAGAVSVSFHTWCMYGGAAREAPTRGSGRSTRSVLRQLSNTTTYVQDEVLRLLRELVHRQRHELAAEFSTVDAAGTGTVQPAAWAEVMGTILQVPWYSLRTYLVDANSDGLIHWMSGFLRRFRCPLEEKIFARWAPYILQWVLARAEHIASTSANSAGGTPEQMFDRETDRGKTGWGYKAFFNAMKDGLNTRMSNEVIYHLFCWLDAKQGKVTGQIARADWLSACREAKPRGLVVHERTQDGREARVTSDFHLWDFWLLQRFRELFHGTSDTVSAFRLLDHDRDKFISDDDLRHGVANLGLTISQQAQFRKQARVWAGQGDDADELAHLFGSPADARAVKASKAAGPGGRSAAVIQTWPMSNAQVSSFRQLLDYDKDGKVSYRDFMFSFYIRDVVADEAALRGGHKPLIWHENNQLIWSDWHL